MRVTERLSHDYPKSEIAGNGSSDNKKVLKAEELNMCSIFV